MHSDARSRTIPAAPAIKRGAVFDRFQALAEPNTIVIGQNTRLIVGNLFEYRDLGAIELKGFSEPVQAYQVLRPSVIAAVPSHFPRLRGREEAQGFVGVK